MKKTSFHRYANRAGNAGVAAYALGSNFIDVAFQNGHVYRYTYASAGKKEVEEMKQLATAGEGLSRYINIFVRNNYAARLK